MDSTTKMLNCMNMYMQAIALLNQTDAEIKKCKEEISQQLPTSIDIICDELIKHKIQFYKVKEYNGNINKLAFKALSYKPNGKMTNCWICINESTMAISKYPFKPHDKREKWQSFYIYYTHNGKIASEKDGTILADIIAYANLDDVYIPRVNKIML